MQRWWFPSYLHLFTSLATTKTRKILKDDSEPPKQPSDAQLQLLGKTWQSLLEHANIVSGKWCVATGLEDALLSIFFRKENHQQFTFMEEKQEYYNLVRGLVKSFTLCHNIYSKEICIIETLHRSHLFTIWRLFKIDSMRKIYQRLLIGKTKIQKCAISVNFQGFCHLDHARTPLQRKRHIIASCTSHYEAYCQLCLLNFRQKTILHLKKTLF